MASMASTTTCAAMRTTTRAVDHHAHARRIARIATAPPPATTSSSSTSTSSAASSVKRRDRVVGALGDDGDAACVKRREGDGARWRRRRRRRGVVVMTRASSSSSSSSSSSRRVGGRGSEPSMEDYYDYERDRRAGIRATRVSMRSSGRQFIPSDVLETLPEGMLTNDADVIESSFLDDFVEDVAEGAGAAETRGRRRALERAYETWTREVESMGVSKRARGLILFAVIMCFYGANITLVKVAQQSMSTDVFAGLRFGVGALVFSPFLKYAARDERVIRGGLELGLWCSLGYYLQNIGLQYTDAARASFISSFTIITVPMLAGLAGREVKSATWGATGIAVAGLAMMENLIPIPGVVDTVVATNAQGDLIDGVSDLIDVVVDADVDVVAGTAASMADGVASVALDVASGQSGTLVGDLCTLGSALLFGTHIFRTDCIFNGAPLAHKESMGLVCLQMLTVVACFSGLLVYDYVDNAGDMQAVLGFSDWSSVSWSSVFFIGAISTAGCIYLETVAVTLIASQEATLMYSTEPIWGAVFAYFLLGETLSPSASIGAGLILLSTLVGARAVGEETTAND